MKALLATTLLLTTTSIFAHDSCNVNLTSGVHIQEDFIEFSENKKPMYKIVDNERLYIDDEEIQLTSSQQSLVADYSNSIRDVIPEVKGIALDGIDLAIDGVNLAFNELLGSGNSVGVDLTNELTNVRREVEVVFNDDKGFYIDENGFEGEDFFGEEFEQRIESVVEEAVKNSMGTLLIAVGQELLFAGGDMEAFETRMQDFGHQIEQEMESRGEQLEKRGEKICQSAVAIDNLEEQLKLEIPELAEFNVLSTSTHNNDEI